MLSSLQKTASGWFFLLLLLSSVEACEANMRSSGRDWRYSDEAITDGTPSIADQAVVGVFDNGIICTGTLIAPQVVLTAGHCLGGDVPAAFFGLSPQEGGTLIDGFAAYRHPDLNAALDNDLGILILAEPSFVSPIKVFGGALDISYVGQPVRIVGYGQTLSDSAIESQRRYGTARVESVSALELRLVPNPSLPCIGDSGGPVLMMSEDGSDMLVGVISGGDAGCATFARAVHIDSYTEEFVRPFLPGFATDIGARCYYDENCVSGVCAQPWDSQRGYCTTSCTEDAEACGVGFWCKSDRTGGRRCLYAAPSPGALGAFCSDSASCDSQLCVSPPLGGDKICSQMCFSTDANPCPDGFECQLNPNFHGRETCVLASKEFYDDTGCVSVGTSDSFFPSCSAVLLLALAILIRNLRWKGCPSPKLRPH